MWIAIGLLCVCSVLAEPFFIALYSYKRYRNNCRLHYKYSFVDHVEYSFVDHGESYNNDYHEHSDPLANYLYANPANGLPMIGGMTGWDYEGNTWGQSSIDTFDNH